MPTRFCYHCQYLLFAFDLKKKKTPTDRRGRQSRVFEKIHFRRIYWKIARIPSDDDCCSGTNDDFIGIVTVARNTVRGVMV